MACSAPADGTLGAGKYARVKHSGNVGVIVHTWGLPGHEQAYIAVVSNGNVPDGKLAVVPFIQRYAIDALEPVASPI